MPFFLSSKSWVFKRLTLEHPGFSVSSQLWPPLEAIQASLSGEDAGPSGFGDFPEWQLATGKSPASLSQQAGQWPEEHTTSRLAEVDHESWTSGSLISIQLGRGKAGVLLDRHLQGERWAGWLTAPETSWAGAFDMLLEPVDEPFDLQFAVIQTWNRVELECSDSVAWHVAGQVSQQRLAVIRLVANEYSAGLMLSTPCEPGFIALRVAAGTHMVLTGTPLSKQDPRHAYQRLYRSFAARLVTRQLTHRIFSWEEKPEVDDFTEQRRVVDFRVKFKHGVLMPQVQPLLRATLSYVVSGPDQDSCYAIKSSNPEMARVMFAQSMLIDKLVDV
jgi:hypothetical protein